MENKLALIVQESGLEKTKAEYILKNFQDYFKLASDWEKKAKVIKVTNEDQKAEMKMAREGRLFLAEKRIAVENTRKKLKEQSLREGKAIDGIANVLKALIVPIEEYLKSQERFVEIKEERKREALMIEQEKRLEEDRLKKEKEEREEQERIRKENEKLKKEMELKEAKQKKIDEAKEKELAKIRKEKEEADAKRLKLEQEIADKKLKEDEEKRLKQLEEEKLKQAPDKEKLLLLAEELVNLKMPKVKTVKAKEIISSVERTLKYDSDKIKLLVEYL